MPKNFEILFTFLDKYNILEHRTEHPPYFLPINSLSTFMLRRTVTNQNKYSYHQNKTVRTYSIIQVPYIKSDQCQTKKNKILCDYTENSKYFHILRE
jgi:hypothetical protein